MSRKKSLLDPIKLKKIGAHIKAIRRGSRLKQPEFAKSIGISQSSLSDIENGKYEPSRPILISIEYQYSVSPEQILTGEGFNLATVKPRDQKEGVAEPAVVYADHRPLSPGEALDGTFKHINGKIDRLEKRMEGLERKVDEILESTRADAKTAA